MAQGLSSRRNLALLAIGAVVTELATIVPYLAAIGLITRAELDIGVKTLTLAGYGFVMILPALVLFCAYGRLKSALAPYLQRLGNWLARKSYDNLRWATALIGFYLAANAVRQLL